MNSHGYTRIERFGGAASSAIAASAEGFSPPPQPLGPGEVLSSDFEPFFDLTELTLSTDMLGNAWKVTKGK